MSLERKYEQEIRQLTHGTVGKRHRKQTATTQLKYIKQQALHAYAR